MNVTKQFICIRRILLLGYISHTNTRHHVRSYKDTFFDDTEEWNNIDKETLKIATKDAISISTRGIRNLIINITLHE